MRQGVTLLRQHRPELNEWGRGGRGSGDVMAVVVAVDGTPRKRDPAEVVEIPGKGS